MNKTNKSQKHVVITVTGKDKPGIVALISGELFKQGLSIDDTIMSILQGEFTMMLVAKPVVQRFSFAKFSKDLKKLGEDNSLLISVRQSSFKNQASDSPTYIVSVFGADKPCIVSAVSDYFGKKNINIADMKTLVTEYRKYAMLLEIDMPASVSFSKVEDDLTALAKKLNVHIDIQHSGVFKVMHRI